MRVQSCLSIKRASLGSLLQFPPDLSNKLMTRVSEFGDQDNDGDGNGRGGRFDGTLYGLSMCVDSCDGVVKMMIMSSLIVHDLM